MPTFPLSDFLARFPQFDKDKYTKVYLQNAGQRASMHITPDSGDMPMKGYYRFYALFLMTAHIITLDDMQSDDSGVGGGVSQIAGTPFKASVGTVSIENTKPNSFQSDDWTYWLSQTSYGRELLAYLDTQACGGIFLNTAKDSVRDLL